MVRFISRSLVSVHLLLFAALSFTQVSAAARASEDALPTPSADVPGEPVYLANQISPECDTGVVYYPGKKLAPRNGCDSWSINLLERPFSLDGKSYIPELDLAETQMGLDDYWFYWKIERYPAGSEIPQPVKLVIELDTDLDGRGDTALMVSTEQLTGAGWQKEGVYLLEDQNNDVGGLKPIIPDGASLTGNGYEAEKEVVVWARATELRLSVEFALPISYFETKKAGFGWLAWALPENIVLSQFDLVDSKKTTELFGVDNTCMMIYGDSPKSDLASQCFKSAQQSAGKKKGGCVQGAKPSADSCWIWMAADCRWQCFN